MIKLTKILISHSLDCKKNFKVVGNRKLEIIHSNMTFENSKEVCDYWRNLSNEIGIKKENIDFYTIDESGKGVIVK